MMLMLCGVVFGWIVEGMTGFVKAVDNFGQREEKAYFTMDRR